VVEILQGDERFSTLLAAVQATGLTDALVAEPYTIFAPTNDAFASLIANLETTPEELLADTDLVTEVLTYHVVPVPALSTDLSDGQVLPTLNGGNVTVSLTDGMVVIIPENGPDATVVEADIVADNGTVVHGIDQVLIPN
jgi:transforming growth factor-beta-induced protein